MNISEFDESSPGRLIPVSGIRGITHAFVPAPLPPDWAWPGALWPKLLEARIALSALDGIGRHLPDAALILRPLQHREAQKSSSLEGTVTDPQRQALFRLDPKYPTSERDPVNAYREVFNYGKALEIGLENPDGLPHSKRLIRNLHAVLMDGVRGQDQQPGEFRDTQNLIGSPPRYVPPPVQEMHTSLDELESFLHRDRSYDPLVEAFLVHYQFEAIHPFRDGNGRVGRLLLAILIADWCELSSQWLYMSSYFDANGDEYNDRLLRVSTHADWTGWVEFCLVGTKEAANDAQRRCEQLIELSRDFQLQVHESGGSRRLPAIAEGLFHNPVVQPAYLAQEYGVAYNTARADLDRLVEAGVLRDLSEPGKRLYSCEKILDITFAE